MTNKILFIFEGVKREKQFHRYFDKILFSNEDSIIIDCYGNNIYELYKELQDDSFNDFINIFTVLQKKDGSCLGSYKREDFAEVYLFFDYDPHDSKACDAKIIKMLELFNNETEFGLLFISYPMIESLYHTTYCRNIDSFLTHNVDYDQCSSFKTDISKENIQDKGFDLVKYDHTRWANLFILHCKKANFIVNKTKDFPESCISQEVLFTEIKKLDVIPVLSAFPLMYQYYYGEHIMSYLEKEPVSQENLE